MADAQPTQNTEQPAGEKPASQKPADGGASGAKVWIIAAIVAVVSAGGGLGISKLSANSSMNVFKHSAEPAAKETAEAKPAIKKEGGAEGGTWFFKLDPVVANLDEPGALRYIRVAVYIEMEGAEGEESKKAMEEKKPPLINWLQLYLAGRSLEEAKGEKNLKAMQAQILEGFNQILFPKEKSLIKGVLFGEINIQ
jgi:flagellar basal body-associated protein FliL